MTGRIFILVSLGGAIGSFARYVIATWFTKLLPSAFPSGTFAVNVVGCLVIGIAYGLSERYGWFTPDMRLFIATGICGGFTTFSSFAYENIKLLQEGNYLTFAMYSLVSYVVGLFSAFGGLIAVKSI